jgi:hypothetical protein
MITAEQMVQREVNCCLSGLVSTLARGACCLKPLPGTEGVAELMEQAFELALSIPDDYEESAIQAGWSCYEGVWRHADVKGGYLSAVEACDNSNLEPYAREVYEHWSVSSWLAEKLIEQGEKVDTDFAGMNVWARTCTGEGIASDGVIERIHAAMVAPVPA